ncbi:hypothetical protein B7P34_28830 [Streptosporangium nondiastaticum]|uniref:Antibiotic biosynthesis monooxygenase n=1 Tax=Streptosporangium nondiastaticum TaxID=35764 RepID=A0A9X7JKE5_9ACTN|nr:antibiotic biosynthesis monooxygenase [Streptosporangium nondiastaticum]PSJ25305.1 hypothetical protein B7P34_28830 [Streptosporangium nondiastaticum]
MTAVGASAPEVGWVTFGTLKADSPRTAAALVESITREVTAWVRHTPGFVSARTHLSVDGTTVVNRGQWESETLYREFFQENPAAAVLRSLADHPGVLEATVFAGTEAPGLQGPEAGAEPGMVAVATRHLAGGDSAAALMELLADSGEWKRSFPGFISATPHFSKDGTAFVNYPMWVSEVAYRSWMADPRIGEGQAEIARLEVAPPQYLVCTVASHIDASPAGSTDTAETADTANRTTS